MSEEGTVKFFNAKKGWGMISRDGNLGELFCHYSDIVANGFKTLEENQCVKFEIVDTQKGLKAVKIQVL